MVSGMSTAIQIAVDHDTSWRVSREGSDVATIAVRQEQGEFLVVTGISNTEKPYRFDTLQAADAFLSDLMTSFSYLGCDIASTT
jgi:GTP-dependent phosphoenolpyruvate carboxykinase